MCQRENIKEVSTQETLVDFLNDLGVILHFKDLQLLDTHVLDPRWVTGAVYRIINSEILAAQKGVLDLKQLPSVLQPSGASAIEYTVDKHSYIID